MAQTQTSTPAKKSNGKPTIAQSTAAEKPKKTRTPRDPIVNAQRYLEKNMDIVVQAIGQIPSEQVRQLADAALKEKRSRENTDAVKWGASSKALLQSLPRDKAIAALKMLETAVNEGGVEEGPSD